MIHDDLSMRKLCAKRVLKMLIVKQKKLRLSICEDFLERTQSEERDWMNSIITLMKVRSINVTLRLADKKYSGLKGGGEYCENMDTSIIVSKK